MLNETGLATWEEYYEVVDGIRNNYPLCGLTLEWDIAIGEGWDSEEYRKLYVNYVESTQIKLKPQDSPTELKGRPLEMLVRYFLEKGGIVKNPEEISEPQKWQVDGQGILKKKHVLQIWGKSMCDKMGFQLYMEAKNHIESMTGNEFSVHCRRMTDHACNLGVVASTSGYRIARGTGIAETIHYHYWQNTFHLLLAFHSFCEVLRDNKSPWEILTEALDYAVNNKYVNNRVIQEKYSQDSCHELILEEYGRLFGGKA
ncbi:MAG: hypothetical protein JXA21_06425 [Anaerolineae bacterium]|nr:hypothetical protein [Anaerolineae bacterium]